VSDLLVSIVLLSLAHALDIGILRSSYGQSDDYFDIDYSEPNSEPYRRSILMALLSPLMLKSAEVYAEELHNLRDNFSLARWRKFVNKVDISIRDSNLLVRFTEAPLFYTAHLCARQLSYLARTSAFWQLQVWIQAVQIDQGQGHRLSYIAPSSAALEASLSVLLFSNNTAQRALILLRER
jgi:hypothetical protein